MARKVCLVLLIGLDLAACSFAVPGVGTNRPTPGPGVSVALNEVPLKLPRLEHGQPCSLSVLSQLGPHLGMALGSGPVHVFNGESIRSGPQHLNSKIVWAASPGYSGPIRIRGGRIDGSGQLLLGGPDNQWRGAAVKRVEGTDLYTELDYLESHSSFPNVPVGWRLWPSATYVAAPGCYAWQVDGIGFTELITFHSLDLPTLPADAECPVSPQQVAHTLSAEFGYGRAVGAGPIYALMGEMQEGVLRYSQSYSQSHYKDGWAFSKVLWMANPEINGRILIRGRQIDAPADSANWIGFGSSETPEFALQWEVTSHSGWASLPSLVRIRAPGCYAYQVDSQKGSEVIVFQVVGIP